MNLLKIFSPKDKKECPKNTPQESPEDFSDDEVLKMQTAILREQGYTDSQINKVLGINEMEECDYPLSFTPEKLPASLINSDVKLCLYHAGWLDKSDATVFSLMANTEKIKNFLPGLDFSSEEGAQKTLMSHVLKIDAKLGFAYVIRTNNIPLGMIFVNTPLYNQKALNLKIWTIDFFIIEGFEHQGIMFNSLIHILNLLKVELHVKKIYATVDEDNVDCLNLVNNVEHPLFNEIDNRGFKDKDNFGRTPKVFVLDLTMTNFMHK